MTENKYQRGKIYKLISNQTDDAYYGSTCEDKLTNRLAGHRRDYKCWLNGKRNYIASYEIVKFDDTKIILVETFPCNTIYELHAREQYYIDNNECVNKNNACTNKSEYNKQYWKDHKDAIQQYCEARKEIKAEYDKQYREKNKEKRHTQFECPCGGKYLQMHKATHEKTKKHQQHMTLQSELTGKKDMEIKMI